MQYMEQIQKHNYGLINCFLTDQCLQPIQTGPLQVRCQWLGAYNSQQHVTDKWRCLWLLCDAQTTPAIGWRLGSYSSSEMKWIKFKYFILRSGCFIPKICMLLRSVLSPYTAWAASKGWQFSMLLEALFKVNRKQINGVLKKRPIVSVARTWH